MAKKIGRGFSFLLFLFIFTFICEAGKHEWLKNAPGTADYPDARGILRSERRFDLLNDGKVIEKNSQYIKILTPAGREKYSDYRIPYNKESETLHIVWAVTVKEDLSEAAVGEDAMNDVTPPFLSDARIYSNLLHRVLSFPVVEPGVALYIDYEKTRDFKDEEPHLGDVLYFQTNDPVLEQGVTFSMPAGRHFVYRFVGLDAELQRSSEGDRTIYSFTAKEAPQIKEEEYMPSMKELSQRLYFSTYKDWQEATRPFAQAFYQAVTPDASITQKAMELTGKDATRRDKIQNVFLFVASEIRNVRLELGIAGYRPHPAPEVLKNRYGDWRDKAVLLASLLKAAGIDAHPVLANSENIEPVADVPTMKQFDMLLLAVDDGRGGKLFLNPFAENSRFGYFFQGNHAQGLEILPAGTAFVEIKPFPERQSMARNICELTLTADGSVEGVFTSILDGYFDTQTRGYLKDLKGEELLMQLERLLNDFNASTAVKNYDLSDMKDLTAPVKATMAFRGADFGIRQGAIMSVEIPQFPFWFADLPGKPRLAERLYPFRVPTDGIWTYTLNISLPEGYQALHLPPDQSHATAYGVYTLSCDLDESSRVVSYTQNAVFVRKDVPPADYTAFKEKLESLNLLKNRLLLFEKQDK